MNLIVLGAPGAGKGTQARMLAKCFKLTHISTGDLLREQIKLNTDLGKEIDKLLKNGQLVSDALAVKFITKQFSIIGKDNFILDGYPRTLKQAQILDDLCVNIDKVISINVEDDVIIERMSGRMTCSNCNAMYHLFYHPPKHNDVCDVCHGKLVQRDDDKTKTVINRLKIYHELTEPIISFYADRNILLQVDGTKNIEQITAEIIGGINGYHN